MTVEPIHQLKKAIFPLQIPLRLDVGKGWAPHPLFRGWTRGLSYLSCHASVLATGQCPHSPHSHKEEEVLLLLSGEVALILPEHASDENKEVQLSPGQFAYYPAHYPHTLKATSPEPANYLMFKWQHRDADVGSPLGFGRYAIDHLLDTRPEIGFHHRLVFEGPTRYLKKLNCHASTLTPGVGYDPHRDLYDVAIVVLSGEVRTLGQRAGANSVIFYPAGELHGMHNPAGETATYLVFEFHSRRPYAVILEELKHLGFWKHELRYLLNRIAKMLWDRRL